MCARQDQGYARPESGSMEDFRDELLNFRDFAANLHASLSGACVRSYDRPAAYHLAGGFLLIVMCRLSTVM